MLIRSGFRVVMGCGASVTADERDRPPKVKLYGSEFAYTKFLPLEDRMNILAMGQRKGLEERLKREKRSTREFVLAERSVVGCSHVWKPVHKLLHREYMHCLRCGAVKHNDGTIWFFVGRKAVKLMTEKP
jgi:hypothetical protein